MTIKFQYKTALVITLLGFTAAFGQKKDENIGSEVVNVVKPYTPTISDAFKVKETPVIEDDDNTDKQEIQYNIFSFPVASTFTPAKGRAAGVEKEKSEKLYSNYATLGVGNYGTVNAEVFITHNLNRNEYVGGMLRHLSSQGGIDGVLLDDKYYTTGLDITYGNRQKGFNWSTDLGYQNQVYNWYGLPQEVYQFTEEEIGLIDPQQTYHTFYIGGKIAAEDSFFRDATAQYKRFWDAFGSAENRFYIKPSLDIPVAGEKFKVDFIADYVGGTFEDGYYLGNTQEYSNFNLGLQPSILYQTGSFSAQLGAGLFYSMATRDGGSDNKFYVYPQIKASYKVVGDLMVAYAGAEGTLRQNSYAEIVSENPFVSPTLDVAPTNQQYDVYVGLKGKLANSVAYNLRGSYMNEDDRLFYLSNMPMTLSDAPVVPDPYGYGNSFGVVYDRLRTISFFGELRADFSKSVSFGINGTYYSYDTDLEEAWNLPSMRVGADLDVDITEKWSAGVNVFFVGDRKDRLVTATEVFSVDPNGNITSISDYNTQVVTLKNYFDVNAHVGYKYSERLTGFLRLNNIANQEYERWLNYQVQGFQFVLGASYKFNF